MNDAAVTAIWDRLMEMEQRVTLLEGRQQTLRGRVRARLREEAEERELEDQEAEKARWEIEHDL